MVALKQLLTWVSTILIVLDIKKDLSPVHLNSRQAYRWFSIFFQENVLSPSNIFVSPRKVAAINWTKWPHDRRERGENWNVFYVFFQNFLSIIFFQQGLAEIGLMSRLDKFRFSCGLWEICLLVWCWCDVRPRAWLCQLWSRGLGALGILFRKSWRRLGAIFVALWPCDRRLRLWTSG